MPDLPLLRYVAGLPTGDLGARSAPIAGCGAIAGARSNGTEPTKRLGRGSASLTIGDVFAMVWETFADLIGRVTEHLGDDFKTLVHLFRGHGDLCVAVPCGGTS